MTDREWHGLMLLIGPPGAGKSTFLRTLIAEGEISPLAVMSNDRLARELFGDDVDRELHNGAIFAEQDRRVSARLQAGLMTFIDATNVRSEARIRLIELAKAAGQPVTAVRFRRSDETLLRQNRNPDRDEVQADGFVLEYARIMDASTSDEQLRGEGISEIVDV
ncbi:MAG: ATP-binding protein [Thermomicrobiales bacterium]